MLVEQAVQYSGEVTIGESGGVFAGKSADEDFAAGFVLADLLAFACLEGFDLRVELGAFLLKSGKTIVAHGKTVAVGERRFNESGARRMLYLGICQVGEVVNMGVWREWFLLLKMWG